MPLFKKGNSTGKPCNYRSVSLTRVVCKVVQRIVKDNIVEHLNEYNIIKDIINLLEFFKEVNERIDNG